MSRVPTRLQDQPTNDTCHEHIFKSLLSTVQRVSLSLRVRVEFTPTQLAVIVVAVVW